MASSQTSYSQQDNEQIPLSRSTSDSSQASESPSQSSSTSPKGFFSSISSTVSNSLQLTLKLVSTSNFDDSAPPPGLLALLLDDSDPTHPRSRGFFIAK
ncbi:hypothetical protein HYFRA_00010809 [Hymenoscyphus fraxineus]|uniref:Uncharacterized protein n=1 Tax=Hymenoscyphus fraxineus TaxID=746836 RepID=A0A9N9PW44_9HELO|nr:hypothetical protein HYFRA_00010809 [Hymenoscyphus fraxineus]